MSDRVSDTPRTDRVARGRTEIASPTVVDVEFVRGLERELVERKADNERLREVLKQLFDTGDALPYTDVEFEQALHVARRALATNSRKEGEG